MGSLSVPNVLNFGSPCRQASSCNASSSCRIAAASRRSTALQLRCSDDNNSIRDGDNGAASPPSSPVPSKKGFGSSSRGWKKEEKGGGGVGQGSSSRLSKVIDIVDKKSSGERKSSGRSSIDPAQAKLGKVDFVRVQNWGLDGEDAPKLEDLRVKSFSPAATSAPESKDGPFYKTLVNRLQLLESKGEIAVAQAKPLPSFDRWAFGEDRYIQFLVDELCVFEALRDSIGAVRKERCRIVDGRLEEVVPLGGAACALSLFEVELGLDRCEALSADMNAILSSSGRVQESGPEGLTANTQAIGYAKYLRQLGNLGLGEGETAKDACLKLLAHLFAVYVSHLTTGMRIGAKALDNVTSLRKTKALSFYRDYPEKVKEPLELFMATVNSAGTYITSDDDQEQVMDELAKAFQRTSLLLSTLAVEESFS